MEQKVVLIKKYENRRLYDTVNSRYVNLDDVAGLLQDGATVRVVDAATGEDITRIILTQIIVEDAKAPDSIFPLEVLRQMVLASSRATQQGAVDYMKSMMNAYQRSFRAMFPGVVPNEPAQPAAGPAVGPPNAPASSTVAGGPQAQRAGADPAGSASRSGASTPTGGEVEIEQLRSRLAELEAAVSGLKPERKAATSKKSNRDRR